MTFAIDRFGKIILALIGPLPVSELSVRRIGCLQMSFFDEPTASLELFWAPYSLDGSITWRRGLVALSEVELGSLKSKTPADTHFADL